MMKCELCKFNDNCEPRNKAHWLDDKSIKEGRHVLGCTEGKLDKLRVGRMIKSYENKIKKLKRIIKEE